MLHTECQKNSFRFLLAFLVGISLIFTACSSESTKQKHLARGEEYLQKRKFQEAAMEFRAAADIDKNSAPAHWGLARVREGQGDLPETVNELRQVLALDANNLEAKSKLGNYLLLYTPPQIQEAEKFAAEILAADPKYIEGYILKASVLSAQNKSEKEVTDVLQQAIALDDKRVESYLSLARFYMKLNKAAEAENTIKKAISVNDKSPLGYLEYGRFYAYSARPNEAETQFKKAVEVDGTNLEVREALAGFYVAQRDFAKAEQAYKDLAQAQDNSSEGLMQLANFYSLVGRQEDAVNVLHSILKDSPEYVRARYRLGEIHLERKENDKAKEQIEKLLYLNDTDAQALLLRARLNLQENKAEDSVKDLEEILKKQPAQKDALFYMTQARIALGQVAEARAFIGDLDRYHAGYLPAKLLKIQASFAANENDKALQQSNELIDALRSPAPNFETSAQDIQQLRVRALSMRGQAYLALGKPTEARADLQEVLKLSPNSSSALTNSAKVEFATKNYPEALNLYEKAFAADAKNFDALSGIVAVLKAQNQFAQAQERIDKVLTANADQKDLVASLHYLKADVYITEKNLPAAQDELQKAMQADENYLPAYSTYAALLVEQNQIDSAVEQYQKVVEKKPSAAIYTVIGMLEDARQNYDAAEKNYRQALQVAPDAAIAGNNLAWLIAANDRGNLDEALKLAQKAVDTNSSVAGFYDTLGLVFLKKGLSAPAIEQMKKAVALDDTEAKNAGRQANSGYRLRLGMALASAGDKPSAKREVETALKREQDLSQKEAQDAKNLLASL
jgi:tetratricopeptide (TPR) repeat protein